MSYMMLAASPEAFRCLGADSDRRSAGLNGSPNATVSGAFGEIDPWNVMSTHTFNDDEVYVLRLHVTGAPMREALQALAFVRAAGQSQNLKFDVRGIALGPTATDGEWNVDVVFTTTEFGIPTPFVSDDAESMAKAIAADPDVQRVFPGVHVDGAVFGRLDAPTDAIDHWRSQPLLWDHALDGGGRGRGGPTDTFAVPVEYSVVKGKADDGKHAIPWRTATPPLTGDKKPPSSSGGLWLWGAFALGAVVWLHGTGR